MKLFWFLNFMFVFLMNNWKLMSLLKRNLFTKIIAGFDKSVIKEALSILTHIRLTILSLIKSSDCFFLKWFFTLHLGFNWEETHLFLFFNRRRL